MRYEKILKREDGTRVKIEVDLSIYSHNGREYHWSYAVRFCLPNKRKFICAGINCDVSEWATIAEIKKVQLELWEKIKP